MLERFFRNNRMFEPRRAKYQGFVPTGHPEFKHRLFSEFSCHEDTNPNDTGLLRLWDFSVEDEFLVEESRRPVAERERTVLGHIRVQNPEFYDNYVLRSIAHDGEFTLRYSEIFDRQPDLERLTRFAPSASDLPIVRRLEIARLFLDGVAALHRLRVAHRDLDRHSVWIDEARSKVVLSGFGAAHFPARTSIGAARSKLLAGGVRVPEDEGRSKPGTPFQHDVFLAGAVVWNLLAGDRLPLDGNVPKQTTGSIEATDVPPQYAEWFDRCLAAEPLDRFADGVEAADSQNSAGASTNMKLTFLGAAGTVTGSKYLLESPGQRWLVDCGLFQGHKSLRLRNWERFPIDPRTLTAVLLTHAHIDHSGYLPLLVRNGFRGPIYCSSATADLCEILLPDSGYLQEKDAEFANRYGYSKHKPALPLYTERDARAALNYFKPLSINEEHALGPHFSVTLRRTGHILGACSIQVASDDLSIVFSGDLGRYDDPILHDPTSVRRAEYLVVESTYGDRLHERMDPAAALEEIVARTVVRGGTVIIPAFAVGRAQSLMYWLRRLKESGRLGNVPVFLDSPMAVDASELLCRHLQDHRLSEHECRTACGVATYVRRTEDSKALTANPVPKVIISASGMATGGRVLHHLKSYAPDPKNTILFAGFQAAGTRGAAMVSGTSSVRIHGGDIPVRAEVQNLSMFSAHADATEIVRWLRKFERAPRTTFITHGEPTAAEALKQRIDKELGWACSIPRHLESAEL